MVANIRRVNELFGKATDVKRDDDVPGQLIPLYSRKRFKSTSSVQGNTSSFNNKYAVECNGISHLCNRCLQSC